MPILQNMGQSNNDAYAVGFVPYAMTSLDSRLLAWNSRTLKPTDDDGVADLGTDWIRPQAAQRPYNVSPGIVTSAIWCCHYLTVHTNQTWINIHTPRGSRKIETWWNATDGNGPNLIRACAVHDRAVTEIGGSDAIRVLDWQGNELDCADGTPLDDYKGRHHGMVEVLFESGRINGNTVVMITGLSPLDTRGDAAAFNVMLASLVGEYQALGFKSVFVPIPDTYELTSGTVHLTAESQYQLGVRKGQFVLPLVAA